MLKKSKMQKKRERKREERGRDTKTDRVGKERGKVGKDDCDVLYCPPPHRDIPECTAEAVLNWGM